MRFRETNLRGLWIIELEKHQDDRGYFARTWCEEEFRAQGLNPRIVQCSTSFNHKKGTLRGMHWQAEPHAEAKLIRCTRGSIYDVALDLRPASPTFKQWFAIELSASADRMLYISEGFAHGFQTLQKDTEVFYMISVAYDSDSARGARWDDPAFNIQWPLASERIISARDQTFPLFNPNINA